MQKIGNETHLDTDEARGGSTPHILRYVLLIGLLLAVLAMSVIWITGALSEGPSHGRSPTAVEHALGG